MIQYEKTEDGMMEINLFPDINHQTNQNILKCTWHSLIDFFSPRDGRNCKSHHNGYVK